jgi:hypothetical protein
MYSPFVASHFSKAYLAKIGQRGGRNTYKKRGAKHFSKISMMRKSFKGGRPRKDAGKQANPVADK